jgi:hypothetical protein
VKGTEASFGVVTLEEPLISDIKNLWKDEAIQKAYARQNEFQLNDSAA